MFFSAPYTETNNQKIEMAQRQAARFGEPQLGHPAKA